MWKINTEEGRKVCGTWGHLWATNADLIQKWKTTKMSTTRFSKRLLGKQIYPETHLKVKHWNVVSKGLGDFHDYAFGAKCILGEKYQFHNLQLGASAPVFWEVHCHQELHLQLNREQWDSWVLMLQGHSDGDLGKGYFSFFLSAHNATTTLDAPRL